MDASDFLGLLPEGTSVAAVIVVVILFLRQQRAGQAQMESMARDCHDRQKEAQLAFEGTLERIRTFHRQDQEQTHRILREIRDKLPT